MNNKEQQKYDCTNTLYNWNEPSIPDWVEWIAIDGDGEVFGYEVMPEQKKIYWLFSHCEYEHLDTNIVQDGGDTFWKDTLEQRPEKLSVSPSEKETDKTDKEMLQELLERVEALEKAQSIPLSPVTTVQIKLEEKQWYDDIPEKGVLCWVSDGNPDEKETPEIVVLFMENERKGFGGKNGDHWVHATPMTKEEVEEYLL